MSLTLGKIHHWLYGQIKNVEEREAEIIAIFKEQYGKKVDKIVEEIWKEYGSPYNNQPLAELIGESHIHPWLEGAISRVQTREATLVKELMEKYHDQELLTGIYQQNGAKLARKTKNNDEENVSLQIAFERLKNTLIERMPCDRLSEITENQPHKIIWTHQATLHTEFWERAGVSVGLMHQLYSEWIRGFIQELNPQIKHHRFIHSDRYEDMLTI